MDWSWLLQRLFSVTVQSPSDQEMMILCCWLASVKWLDHVIEWQKRRCEETVDGTNDSGSGSKQTNKNGDYLSILHSLSTQSPRHTRMHFYQRGQSTACSSISLGFRVLLKGPSEVMLGTVDVMPATIHSCNTPSWQCRGLYHQPSVYWLAPLPLGQAVNLNRM